MEKFIQDLISNGPNLAYQGFHDVLNPKDIVGYEALLRVGKNPEHLIKDAERLDIVSDFGLAIMKQAIIDSNDMENRKIIAVNASRIEISEKDYAKKVIKCLEDNQKSSQRLMIEVTESAKFPLYAEAIRNLHELKESGILLAIDDFGVENASIMDLLSIPSNFIKIDSCFINCSLSNYHIESQKKDILLKVVEMIKLLDKKIIMEGVEWEWQYELAKEVEADYIQGFFFSKPTEKLFKK